MTQEHVANMTGTPTRFNQVVDLIGGLTGTELHELRDHFNANREAHVKMYEGAIELRLEEAKSFWAGLTIGGDRLAFRGALQQACTRSKAIWAALDQFEELETQRARAEIRAKLQTAVDRGLNLEKATVDGETFHTEDGQVVDGPPDNDSDIPF